MTSPIAIGGRAKTSLEQYFAAIRDFDAAIRLNPNDDFAYIRSWTCEGEIRTPFGSDCRLYDVAIRLKPDDSYTYSSRGIAKHDLKQYSAAIADYNIAIRLNPNDDFALSCRRVVQGKLGR